VAMHGGLFGSELSRSRSSLTIGCAAGRGHGDVHF
jgi:hypothetical protein